MQINGLTSGLDAQGGTEQAARTPKDEFLRLLVAQLQHQNPLEPQEGAEFVAQLAQFTTLEQGAEANNRLASIEAGQAGTARSGYTNIVGRTVTARTDQVQVPWGENSPQLLAQLDGSASKVTVDVFDESGTKVRTIELGARSAGDVAVEWDGLSDDGTPLASGKYRIEVHAENAGGSTVSANTAVRGRVNEVEFNALGGVEFHLGQMVISPGDIVAIGE